MLNRMDKLHLAYHTWTQAGRMIRRQGDAEKLIKIQNHKLSVLIDYVAREIKYYRECFAHASIKADKIRCCNDLKILPILTRQELRTRFWDFLPQYLPASRLSRTSGSTGEPVCLLSDRFSKMANSAAVIRYRKAWGLGPVGGTILAVQKHKDEKESVPYWTWLQGIHQTFSINPYRDSAGELAVSEKMLKGLGKVWVMGITPAVQRLAYLLKNNKLPKLYCEAVFTTGSALEPQVRMLMEEAFDAAVCDVYACNEAGDVAWQCRAGTYHLNMENVVVEIVKDGRAALPGEVGQVVITNLNRRVMPIIRYWNGDWARQGQGPCGCGCGLDTIDAIAGRSGEDVVLSDGDIMGWHRIKAVMNDPRLCEYQILQEKIGAIVIKVHGEQTTDKKRLENLIRRRCKAITGDRLTVAFQWVKKIEPLASGKRKLVVSRVKRVPMMNHLFEAPFLMAGLFFFGGFSLVHNLLHHVGWYGFIMA